PRTSPIVSECQWIPCRRVNMMVLAPAIITLCALAIFIYTIIAVGFARTKYQIKAPATTGNVDFERIFRVQMNTQESLLLFLPALWLFSQYVSPLWGGIIGVVWL